jgi:alkylation response protein AidB-like acyl-CoA dehydrogenase
MRSDLYQGHDYYMIDDLLTTEHKLIRETVRNYVKSKLSPIIEDYAQKAEFPKHIVKELGEIGAFGPSFRPNMVVADSMKYRMALLCRNWSAAIQVFAPRHRCRVHW